MSTAPAAPSPAAHPRQAAVPWRVGDLLVLYATFAVAVLLIGAGWAGASGELRFESQIRWASVSTAGVIVLGAGSLAWLLAGRRNVGLAQRQLVAQLRDAGGPPAGPGPAGSAAVAATDPASEVALVATRVMTRFHRPDCQLVRGKPVRPYQLATHERRGRVACDICEPLHERGPVPA